MTDRRLAIPIVLLLAGSAPIPAAAPPLSDPPGEVRLLSIHLFWVDDEGPGPAGDAAASPSSLDDLWEERHYDYSRGRVLRADDPGGWDGGAASALVVVPRLGDRWAHYTLTTAFRDAEGGRRYRVDSVIGARARGRFGTVHTLDLARVAALPRFARDGIGELVNPHLAERSVYWEAAFELPGLRLEEISRFDALGPGLIRPPGKWLRVLDAMLQPPEIAAEADGYNCLAIGPVRLCLNLPGLAGSLGRDGTLKERSEVRLTGSLWSAGESIGVVVVGRLIDYSVVTFRVRTNGKGAHPKGVFEMRPFRLTGALAPARHGGEAGAASGGRAVPPDSGRMPVALGRLTAARRLQMEPDVDGSQRWTPPASLSLEAILERAFSPERE
jgi:hypothetical protein